MSRRNRDRRQQPIVHANDPCPCGSGRRHKFCHRNLPKKDLRKLLAQRGGD